MTEERRREGPEERYAKHCLRANRPGGARNRQDGDDRRVRCAEEDEQPLRDRGSIKTEFLTGPVGFSPYRMQLFYGSPSRALKDFHRGVRALEEDATVSPWFAPFLLFPRQYKTWHFARHPTEGGTHAP